MVYPVNVCIKKHILHCLILSLMSHQEQASYFQTQFNEEELKNSKLQQQIAKLEEQITVMSQESDHKDEVEFSHVHLQRKAV